MLYAEIRWVLAAPGILWQLCRVRVSFLRTIESPLREEENLQVPRRMVEHGGASPIKTYPNTLRALDEKSHRTFAVQKLVNYGEFSKFLHTCSYLHQFYSYTSTSCFSLHGRIFLIFFAMAELCWSKGSRSSCVFLANSIGSTDGFNGNPKETLALTLNHDIKVCFLQVSA